MMSLGWLRTLRMLFQRKLLLLLRHVPALSLEKQYSMWVTGEFSSWTVRQTQGISLIDHELLMVVPYLLHSGLHGVPLALVVIDTFKISNLYFIEPCVGRLMHDLFPFNTELLVVQLLNIEFVIRSRKPMLSKYTVLLVVFYCEENTVIYS